MAINSQACIAASTIPASRNINFCHTNAESMSAHLHDVYDAVSKNQVHVLGVSESFLKPQTASKLVNMPGYKLFRHDRTGLGRGGVAMYVHESIPAKVVFRSAQHFVYVKRPEIIFVELTLGRSTLLCGTIYSPPGAGFWSDVEEAFLNYSRTYDYAIIMGDFNIDWLKPSTSLRIFRDFLSTFHLSRVPFDTTHHHDANTHTAIDYICVSDPSLLTAYKQEHWPSISKHDLVYATLAFPVPHWNPATISRRSFKSCRFDCLMNDLLNWDWQALVESAEVDRKVQCLTGGLSSVYDIHAPMRTFVPKENYFPWLTPHIKRMIADRNKAWRSFKRRGDSVTHALYKHLRNRVQTEIRNAKHQFFKSKLLRASNSKDMWKTINDLGLTKSNDDSPLPFDAGAFNTHFVNASNHSLSFCERPTVQIAPDERFYFNHVEASDVVEAVKSARSNAIGSDGIQLRQIKDCLPVIICLLMHIFDFSLQSSVFPASWKHALVRPLAKIKTAATLSEFRPISILCAVSKIFESLAAKQILSYISKKGILDAQQSGFRKGFSTHTALINMVDDIRESIDSKAITLLVTIDFSRAFDMMNVDVLIDKLRGLGFSDSACKWVRSFLTNRSQSVILPDGKTSTPLRRCSGVPQGSVLGPLLFSLFINDLPHVLRYCKYHLYADDFVIYYSGPFKDASEIIRKINEDLCNISRWAEDNGLTINAQKTQAMWLGSRGFMSRLSPSHLPPVTLAGEIVQLSDHLKILGVTLDSTLSWRPQCNATAGKCFAALVRLRKHRDFLPASTRMVLIKALIFPYLDYCAGIFLDLYDELVLKLSRCKHAALRFVTGTKIFEHITPDYVANDILSYVARRDFIAINLLVLILKSGEPNYLSQHFRFRHPDKIGSRRCSPLDIEYLDFSTSCFKHSFRVGIIYIWNNLPHSLRSVYRHPRFKTLLFEHYLRK